jgi:hypothetical protein
MSGKDKINSSIWYPSSFEYGVLPLSYNHHIGKFIIGTSKEIVPPNTLISSLRHQEDYVAYEELESLAAGVVFSDQLYTGPVFRDFVATPRGEQIVRDVPEVMQGAFNQVHHTAAGKNSIGELFGFSARIIRTSQVDLSVLGDCACFSPEIGGRYEQYWEKGFSHYTEHNIDWPSQIVALYAGIGHIAYNAEQN